MGVHAACNNEEDSIKNEGARMVTTLFIDFSDAQGQLTLKSEKEWEHSGSVVECLTRDRGLQVPASPASLCCVLEHNINPSLVLAQPRKTCPFITENLLMGLKESNQTNKQTNKQTEKE